MHLTGLFIFLISFSLKQQAGLLLSRRNATDNIKKEIRQRGFNWYRCVILGHLFPSNNHKTVHSRCSPTLSNTEEWQTELQTLLHFYVKKHYSWIKYLHRVLKKISSLPTSDFLSSFISEHLNCCELSAFFKSLLLSHFSDAGCLSELPGTSGSCCQDAQLQAAGSVIYHLHNRMVHSTALSNAAATHILKTSWLWVEWIKAMFWRSCMQWCHDVKGLWFLTSEPLQSAHRPEGGESQMKTPSLASELSAHQSSLSTLDLRFDLKGPASVILWVSRDDAACIH